MKRSKESVYALFVYRAIDYLWTDIAFWDGVGGQGEGTVASVSKSSCQFVFKQCKRIACLKNK